MWLDRVFWLSQRIVCWGLEPSLQQFRGDNGNCGGTDRRDQGGGDNASRIVGARGRTDRNHPCGQQRDGGCVDRQEQRHGIGGGPLMGVQAVQFLHCANAKRGGCIAQTQRIGGDVHDHRTHGRMVGWHIWKQAHHQGAQQFRDDAQQAPSLRHLHQPQEQRHDANQTQSQGDGRFRRADHGQAQMLHRGLGGFFACGHNRGHPGHLLIGRDHK